MADKQTKTTTDQRHICDYPACSVRGAGHPLACNCRSPQTTIPTLRSLADWHVGQTDDGVPEITILLTDKDEARAWAAWLFERNEDA
jgi:hypothetical protein